MDYKTKLQIFRNVQYIFSFLNNVVSTHEATVYESVSWQLLFFREMRFLLIATREWITQSILCVHEIESETKVALKVIPRRRNNVALLLARLIFIINMHIFFSDSNCNRLDTIKIIETTERAIF
jgi:hypothetical protein